MDEVAEEVKPLLIEARFLIQLTMENFFQAIMSLCLHSVLLSRKAELDQFIAGLGPLHALITKHPTKAECLFVTGNEPPPPSAEELLSLMTFEGVQPSIVDFFNEYLKTSEGELFFINDEIFYASKIPYKLKRYCYQIECFNLHVCFCFCLANRLSDLLMFATGCSTIPPVGFCRPSVITVLQNDSAYPNTNTCPLELELPGRVSTFPTIQEEYRFHFGYSKSRI